ncbi:hypothetical protein QYE76_012996 [Lolium multiflorum]|uniref:Uncharacterized protein n=1 Tax=Lolium multiflorum TaxID=4521 RepID=A0AAD8U2W9_LOLMU|nr:hypothetical protein QYE76_012996 [Lolium multiflorum]
MVRAHPMWLYSGPKDETRINAAELSEKELLDEVCRLTHFSQEDSIPLISSHIPFDADHPPTESLINPDYAQDLPNDTSERGDSLVPVGSHTEGNTSSEAEHDDPINPEAIFIDPKSAADDISDTAGSMHDDDADHAAFVDAAAEEAEALPSKRSSGSFADEDDLWDLDEDFIESPPKKSKTGAAPSDLAAYEASAPATIPVAQMSTASSLSKGKNIPSTDAAAAVISSLESFASHYASLEVDKAQLQKEVESSSSKLEGAIKIAAEARTEIDTLKEELKELKQRLRDEEAAKFTVEARALEKDELLRQSSLALLRAADIPVEALDKVPSNSPSNALSMTLASHQLVQDLLHKGKGAMARIHSMIFPKISQDKTLGQLIDAFAINTREVIEVYPVPSFVDDSSSALPESDRLQRMRDRVTQMERDMRNTYALAAIVNKKNELAADTERYALTELHKAAESLNCDLKLLYPKVLLPANMIVDKLEQDSKTPEERETSHE